LKKSVYAKLPQSFSASYDNKVLCRESDKSKDAVMIGEAFIKINLSSFEYAIRILCVRMKDRTVKV
jgi:hypothetical protein